MVTVFVGRIATVVDWPPAGTVVTVDEPEPVFFVTVTV